MAKRTDLKKILIIGSGPIVIGQAAEFDYAGTQACLALKEEGYEVVLCNSNPATIMTDTAIADKVYMEPLTLDYMGKILRYERPDAILPGIGGQTGLNLAMQLEKKGVLKECRVELLGTSSESIERAEDRELFKELCQSIGEPTIPSEITYSLEEAKEAARRIGYPVVLRPAFTLGGTGVMDRIMAFKNDAYPDQAARNEAIGKFLSFFYAPENYVGWVSMEGFLPAVNSSVAALVESDPSFQAWLDVLDSCKFYPTANPKWDVARQGVIEVEQQALTGGDVKALLDDLQAKIDG